MKLTRKEKQIVEALKSGGVLIPGKYPCVSFKDGRPDIHYRVEFLRKLGCKPFVMPYNKSDKYQKAYTRYVNNRIIFNSCSWEDYEYNPFRKSLNHLSVG